MIVDHLLSPAGYPTVWAVQSGLGQAEDKKPEPDGRGSVHRRAREWPGQVVVMIDTPPVLGSQAAPKERCRHCSYTWVTATTQSLPSQSSESLFFCVVRYLHMVTICQMITWLVLLEEAQAVGRILVSFTKMIYSCKNLKTFSESKAIRQDDVTRINICNWLLLLPRRCAMPVRYYFARCERIYSTAGKDPNMKYLWCELPLK